MLIKKMVILILALAALVSVSIAQNGSPTQAYPNIPDGPVQDGEDNENGAPEGATPSSSAPTDTRPQAGAQPQTMPEASTGEAASELGQGESLTKEQVTNFGQVEETREAKATGIVGGIAPAGIQYRVLYNGFWSYGPAAFGFGEQTNMLVSVDQPQMIWSYEKYPSGYEVWEQWGYWYPGDYNAWFYADAVGWHLVAVYGEESGWSDAVWIYVEPGSTYFAEDQQAEDEDQGGDQDEDQDEDQEEVTESDTVGDIQA